MSIVITPNVSPVAAQGVTADIVLQPGSVISARVLQVLGNDQVQISIGGQSIDVVSQVPLQAGQTLQLQVSQTADGIALAVVNQQGGAAASQAPAGATATLDSVTLAPSAAAIAALATPATTAVNNPLTPLETLAVSIAAQSAATQQTSLAPLFANLGVAAGLAGLPPQVQQAVAQVLAQQTQSRSKPHRQRHQAGVPGLRAVSGSIVGVRFGFVIVGYAGSQGGTDRAAPGVDDVAGRCGGGIDARHHGCGVGGAAGRDTGGGDGTAGYDPGDSAAGDNAGNGGPAGNAPGAAVGRPDSHPLHRRCSRSPSWPDRRRPRLLWRSLRPPSRHSSPRRRLRPRRR